MVQTNSNYHQYQPWLNRIIEKISWQVRRQMFDTIISTVNPSVRATVLDVGVTSDERADCNFFEKLYPFANQITAVGAQDASFLEHDFPGLKFIQADGRRLPFKDNSFDLVVSFATIEHVGDNENQKMFMRELCRVGKTICVSTPNRWFPLEFHTLVPLAHWLPSAWFRAICRLFGKNFFADKENLNLLSKKKFLNLVPAGASIAVKKFKLAAMTSNLMLIIKT
ncbi:class I SAM-dependent methyltransferase [Candidatus Falkowbacteria bacterium]|nr:class I SAM-dependent methyltransferase [Candidatus Falkowbacteria bacterium]